MLKNIILQHYNGSLGELEELSVKSVRKYAESIGADYQLIRGKPFNPNLIDTCQKVIIIDEHFDAWDNVLMVDADVFVNKNLTKNVFDAVGIGVHAEPWQPKLHKRISLQHSDIASINHPYWGGAIYKMSRDLRKKLRDQIGENTEWMNRFNRRFNFEDEGIFHVLATRANIPLKNAYIDQKWCYCSYLPNLELANMIHIRKKPLPNKIDNYKTLLSKGII
jgi:hypothetical protein